MARRYYSIRTGRNSMTAGFDLDTMRKLWREDGAQAEADTAPEAGNSPTPRKRRARSGDCPQLQRPQQHDFQARGMSAGKPSLAYAQRDA